MKKNGKKMIKNTVILIDSGIDLNNSALKRKVIGGRNFYYKNGEVYEDIDFKDENGHGTQCASVIENLNPKICFYIIKVTDREGKTNSRLVAKALNYCLRLPIGIISISLSITKKSKYSFLIEKELEKLKRRKRVVLFSVTNGKEISLPAADSNVIGVKGGFFSSNEIFVYYPNRKIQGIFNASPEMITSIGGDKKVFAGNSKACAVCAGILSRLTELNESEEYLIKESEHLFEGIFYEKEE